MHSGWITTPEADCLGARDGGVDVAVLEPNLVSTLAEQERDYLAGVSRVRGRRRYLHTLALWLCGVSSKICGAVAGGGGVLYCY